MIEIDGSYGEGGGQILRTSIALGALLREPIKIFNIRIKRPKPGLAQQHLTGIKAMQKITNAEVSGTEIGSTEVKFSPGAIKSGSYAIDVGTAGSISLVLQTLLLPCAFAKDVIELKIMGGTDVAWSPSMDYLKNVFCSIVGKMKYEAQIKVLKRGYYPKGNGEVIVRISPAEKFKNLRLVERGELIRIKGIAHSSNLPCHIVEREIKAARSVLDRECEIAAECSKYFSTGTGITLWAEYENTVLGGSAIGEIGKPAESVGAEAAKMLLEEMQSGAALDSHMGDQIIPYIALAEGESEVAASKLTNHLKTNIYVVEKILGSKFEISEKEGRYHISVKGGGFKNEFA
ncbi:MAG: RNA 3'-terminal phosphate cyclase [Euryarchaeota archaeon]|nr:RNA 3'-terminal phosphate cyclase [Euryarchaeota archaeon]